MSGNAGESGPPAHAGESGPPAHAGPPERVREKFREANRDDNGNINVSDDPLDELAQKVDWDNLSPFEEYVMAVLENEDLL